MKILLYLSLLAIISATANADSLDQWIVAMNRYLDHQIQKDPYNCYVDIKSDVNFLNDQCMQFKSDITYQIKYTEELLKKISSVMSDRTTILSDKISKYPEALSKMSDSFSVMKSGISALPLKPPCYAKTTSAIDNIKGREVGRLEKTIAFNENNKVVSANMLRIVNLMSEMADNIGGTEMEEGMQEFRKEVVKQLALVLDQFSKNLQPPLQELETKYKGLPNKPEAERAKLAQGYKVECQKKLELVRAKTLMDLQALLQYVVQALMELQMEGQEMLSTYGVVVERAGNMVQTVQSAFSQRVQGAQSGGGKINKIAGLSVTEADGSKVPSTAYIPAYTLSDNEMVYDAAQAGPDLNVLIVGVDDDNVTYTRKIMKMNFNSTTDWVYMWVFKNGEVTEEKKYIYTYDATEC